MARSQLTRLIFRKLCANEPILFHDGCLQRLVVARPALSPSPRTRPGRTPASCRTFTRGRASPSLLKMFQRQSPQQRASEPGLDTLIQYAKLKRLDARLPEPSEVAMALTTFLSYRQQNRSALSDEHARLVRAALDYTSSVEGAGHRDDAFLQAVLSLLADASSCSEPHRELAMVLYRFHLSNSDVRHELPRTRILFLCISALCASGGPGRARSLLVEYHDKHMSGSLEAATDLRNCWLRILKTNMEEGKEQELLKTSNLLAKHEPDGHDRAACAIIARLYARNDKLQDAKKWCDRFIDMRLDGMKLSEEQATELYEDLLMLCIRQNDQEWGQKLSKDIVSELPNKVAWDLVLVWAASTGRGVDHVEVLMDKIDDSGKPDGDSPGAHVDIGTINRLLQYAISRDDPYTAERYIAVGRKRGLEADKTTLRLQMEYRLSVNDISGALTAYQNLQSHDLSSCEDIPACNRLICAMCDSQVYDFESIMAVAADLSDRRARLSAEAISALAQLHLSRGEVFDVTDLLKTHTVDLSSKERAIVTKRLVKHTTDATTDTTNAWDAYSLLHSFFANMDRKQRTLLMESFFKRGRPDMGVHVFNHMRAHDRVESRATADTYIACLQSIATAADPASLQVVHNRFNLDDSIEASTRLRDVFMLAYTACGGQSRALRFWNDIASSREGPSMASIHLAFRACEGAPFGADKAREIWTRLRRAGLDMTDDLWASYLGALAGSGDVDDAIKQLKQTIAEGELSNATTLMLGYMYNAAISVDKQDDVARAAEEYFASTWDDLQTVGMHETESGSRAYNLDRNVKI